MGAEKKFLPLFSKWFAPKGFEMSVRFLDLEHNTSGSDWFCGDLHGTFDELMRSLDEAGFDGSKDRLFCVGDLHDRGPDSLKCLGLLGKPWFYTVDCNHNEVLLDYVAGRLTDQEMVERGATWFLEKPKREQLRVLQVLEGVPTAIRIGRGSAARINLFHAEYLGGDQRLDSAGPVVSQGLSVECKSSLLWGRVLADEIRDGVETERECAESLSPSFVGHTVVASPFEYQNHIFMDCGIWSHSPKSVRRGHGPMNFPLYCLQADQWHFCAPNESTVRYTSSLSDRVRTLCR